MMEGFLKPSGGEGSKKQKSPENQYSDLSLDELQIKIEEQEKITAIQRTVTADSLLQHIS